MDARKKGSAFGYPFLFFSAIFYLWLGFLMTQGADQWLAYSSSNFTSNSTMTDLTNFVNPLSSVGFLLWLSVAIAFVDAYIIVSSIT